jgi:ubiquinone/menaquinone biosynthesis C-methylase UbiE
MGIVQLLLAAGREEFEKKTVLFRKYVEPLIQLGESEYPKSSREGNAKCQELLEYFRIMRWCIRQLEYSFILGEIMKRFGEDLTGLDVLDAGCGTTVLPCVLADMGAQVTGVDVRPSVVEFMSSPLQPFHSDRVRYELRNLQHLSYPSESFDIVTCVSVLEHLSRSASRKTLPKLVKLLRQSGILTCTVDYSPAKKVMLGLFVERALEGIRLLVAGQFEKVKSALRRATPAERPYTYSEIVWLLKPISEFIPSKASFKEPTQDQIRAFWSEHRFPGCLYDSPREYLSVGFCAVKPSS